MAPSGKAAEKQDRMASRATSRGGSSPRARVAKNLPLYGNETSDVDPAEILLREIRRTAGHVEWLRDNLQQSDPEMFVRSLWLQHRQSGYVRDTEIDIDDWSQAGAMWIELYMTERRHLAAICRTALAAGIEERRVRLAERQAERIGEAIKGMLMDLEIDTEDDRVRTIIFKWLTMASGATDAPDVTQNKMLPLEIEDTNG